MRGETRIHDETGPGEAADRIARRAGGALAALHPARTGRLSPGADRR